MSIRKQSINLSKKQISRVLDIIHGRKYMMCVDARNVASLLENSSKQYEVIE